MQILFKTLIESFKTLKQRSTLDSHLGDLSVMAIRKQMLVVTEDHDFIGL